MAKVEQVLSLEPQHELKFRGKPEAGYLLPRARPCATRPGPEGPDSLAVTSAPARRRVRPAPLEAEGQRRPGAGGGGRGRCRSPLPPATLHSCHFNFAV